MKTRLFFLVGVLFTVLLFAQPSFLSAHTLNLPPAFTVNSNADVPADPSDTNYSVCRTSAGNSTCTLRAAIDKANHYPGGGVTINVPSLTPPTTYGLQAGTLIISRTMSIVGGGASGTIVDGSANVTPYPVGNFDIVSGTVAISSLTIQGGHSQMYGGGVKTELSTTVTLTSVVIRNNTADWAGGGVVANGQMLIQNSTIVSNTGWLHGGGVAAFYYAKVQIRNSTISNNRTAQDGGGIYLEYFTPRVDLFNVTVAYNLADLDLNGPDSAGGVYLATQGGVFNARNSILAPNYGTHLVNGAVLLTESDCQTTMNTAVNTTGYSIIGPAVAGCTYSGPWIHNSVTKLDVLKVNGGQTPTHALLPGSPALDAGEAPYCTDSLGTPIRQDQRGLFRPADGGANGYRCDIGAVEMQRLLFLPIVVR